MLIKKKVIKSYFCIICENADPFERYCCWLHVCDDHESNECGCGAGNPFLMKWYLRYLWVWKIEGVIIIWLLCIPVIHITISKALCERVRRYFQLSYLYSNKYYYQRVILILILVLISKLIQVFSIVYFLFDSQVLLSRVRSVGLLHKWWQCVSNQSN